ncbi:MAG TPA: T9SS type A sorting domain-containing protein [Ignavibacteriaceae bacterium]|nr:T9SS type A sorting domain-containing protein [Ignavibacteriaceae bacterium]
MQKLIVPLTVLFLFSLTTQILSQEDDFFRKRIEYSVQEKIEGPVSSPLQAGTYSVGTVGYFPTLDSAFNKLSIDGIEGDVTLELIDDLYIAPTGQYGFRLNGPIPGTGTSSRVTIRPVVDKNITIEGNGRSVLCFINTSYVTIDGIGLTGATTLRIHSNQNSQWSSNDGIVFVNNSKHNEIQNIVFECEDYDGLGCAMMLFYETGPFTPDSNLIENNFVKKAAMGISIISYSYRPFGNIIRENKIGSETDSFISRGINLVCCQNTIVESNIVQNIRSNSSLVYSPGIVSLAGVGERIFNNVIFNIVVNNGDYGAIGIFLNGISGYSGCVNTVYNNMIFDLQSTSPQANSKVSGIELRNQNYAKVYFNSVYLSGTGSNQKGSASLNVGINCSNIQVKNNLFINMRNESPYCAAAINCNSSSCFISNYNDLYTESSQCNFLVRSETTNYKSLNEWQSTGQDLNSFIELPHFIEPYLHIDKSIATHLESGGNPIGGIVNDFDYQLRNTVTPDIGADEFDGTAIVNVAEESVTPPTEFVLNQNYPNPFNPSTAIRYSIPTSGFVTIKVYDILGNEIATLVNEEKTAGNYEVNFDASGLASGMYLYRLQTDSFVETKKMVLLK